MINPSLRPKPVALRTLEPLLVLVLLGTAAGAEELAEPSKVNTWTPITSGVGHGSVELGTWLSRADQIYDDEGTTQDRGGDYRSNQLYLTVTAGVLDDLDLSVSGALERRSDEADGRASVTGGGDPRFQAIWRLWKSEDENIQVGLLPSWMPDWGAEGNDDRLGLSAGYPRGELAGAVSVVNGPLSLAADAAWGAAWGDRGDARGDDYADIAAGWQVTAELQPELELGWTRSRMAGDDSPWAAGLTAGLVALPAEGWSLYAGIHQDLAGANYADRARWAMASVCRSW